MKPLFSIIIPTYDRAEKLRRAISSIERQTFKDFELIICDDGSNDNTSDVVASFLGRLDLKYLREENWGGPARPRNNGLRAASGEWVCFLDADDWWYPDKLSITSRYLQGSDIIYHDLDIYPHTLPFFRRKVRGRRLSHPVFRDLMLRWNAIPNSSAVVRKSLIAGPNGFSEERALIGMEDFDLWLKLARMTERFTYIPRSLGAYWVGEGNLTEVSERQIARYTAIHEHHAQYLSPDDRAQARMLLHYSTARIEQQLGNTDEAQRLFRMALMSKHPRWKLASLAMLILIKWRSLLSDRPN